MADGIVEYLLRVRDQASASLKKAAGDAKDPGLGLLNLLESS